MNNLKLTMKKTIAGLMFATALFMNLPTGVCEQAIAQESINAEIKADVANSSNNDHAVSDTAYLTLYWLSISGNEKAELLYNRANVDFTDFLSRDEDFEKIKAANREYQKLRHDSLNDYVFDNRYKAVIDIACGYSPRGLELSEAGIAYVGCDFKSVTDSMKSLTADCITGEQKQYLSYKVTDVTEREQMISAAEDITEPVCIMTEGLFMYLDKEGSEKALNNIALILKSKGGCFITQDFSTKSFVTETAEAMYPHEGQTIYNEAASIYKATSDDIMNTEFGAEIGEIEAMIKKAGLCFKRVSLFAETPTVNSPNLTAEQQKRLQKVMKKKFMWVITAAEKN